MSTAERVIYFFQTTNCAPCRRAKAFWPGLRKKLPENYLVREVDVRENRALAKAIGVKLVPTFAFLGGDDEWRILQSSDEAEVTKFILEQE